MDGTRRSGLRRRPVTAERQAVKDALWSIHFHGTQLNPVLVPNHFRPKPLTDAIEAATRWEDEHACERRVRLLRRLNREFLSTAERTRDLDAAQGALVQELSERRAEQYGRSYRTDLHTTKRLLEQVRTEVQDPDRARCIPLTDKPDWDPVRERSSLYSEMILRRRLDQTLACLLDPRCWDNCSDLFDDTYAVTKRDDGGYDPAPPNAPPVGTDWKGLLYESASVGPQGVENILQIDFRVSRHCTSDTHRPVACEAGTCGHEITGVNVDYGLYENLECQFGWVELPGAMRQNYGFFNATPNDDGTTTVSCKKTIRYGRVTDWSAGNTGGFDYGDILNYVTPTLQSLWIYDVALVAPCCETIKKRTD